jgi:hypothetical protein
MWSNIFGYWIGPINKFNFGSSFTKKCKNCMKELMARVNGNQDVDGHERHTSTFIISISDRINFVINNG